MLNDQQLKDLQVKSDINRKNVDASAKQERAKEAGDSKAELGREKIQSDAANKALKIRLETSLQPNEQTITDQRTSNTDTPLPALRKNLADINGADPSPFNIEIPKINPTGGLPGA